MKRVCFVAFVALFLSACRHEGGVVVRMETSLGDIRLRLYDETVLHRENMLKLVREGYYNGLLFHRVIQDFMIQAGDPGSRGAKRGVSLGEGDAGYTLKAEILPQYFHKRGVLAAAREGDAVNPERNSSGSHFYIVKGKVFTPESLAQTAERVNERRYAALEERLRAARAEEIARCRLASDSMALERLGAIEREVEEAARQQFARRKLVLSPEQEEAYTTVGGTPHLDGEYTVFGEVLEGMEVVDRISAVAVDEHARPLEDVVIRKVVLE